MTRYIIVFFIACFFNMASLQGQWSFHAYAGGNYNYVGLKDDGNSSALLTPKGKQIYKPAIGFAGGLISRYNFNNRMALSGELMYQQMPYSVKIVSGKLYQSYGSLLLAPSYKVLSWLSVEGGLGIALNIKDYMAFVNDPVIWTTAGIAVPFKRFEFKCRYYRFLTAHSKFELQNSITRSLYMTGIQAGLGFKFWDGTSKQHDHH